MLFCWQFRGRCLTRSKSRKVVCDHRSGRGDQTRSDIIATATAVKSKTYSRLRSRASPSLKVLPASSASLRILLSSALSVAKHGMDNESFPSDSLGDSRPKEGCETSVSVSASRESSVVSHGAESRKFSCNELIAAVVRDSSEVKQWLNTDKPFDTASGVS